MNEALQKKFNEQRETIEAMCARFGVASLDLFGSATAPDWRPDASDLDFVVTFDPERTESLADRFLGLAEALEAAFGTPVDLITSASIRNPYFRASVDATKARVYAQ